MIDGDGSMDPAELVALLEDVTDGRADLAVGRRRPSARGVWPWHARAGNAVVLWWLRRRIGMPLHDIAPMRVARREDLLALGVEDRRFGYPVELLQRATAADWRFVERDISYYPRAAGTRSKVSGSVRGHDPRRSRLRPGALVRPAVALVVAKSPVVGRAKTRLGREVGMERAADLAAAALLDTVTACAAAFGAERCHLALDGILAHGQRADELLEAVADWTVHPQRGDDFAERLLHAHEDAAAFSGAPVVQVGMDTPQLHVASLLEAAVAADQPRRSSPRPGVRRWLVAPRGGRAAPARPPARGADVHRRRPAS